MEHGSPLCLLLAECCALSAFSLSLVIVALITFVVLLQEPSAENFGSFLDSFDNLLKKIFTNYQMAIDFLIFRISGIAMEAVDWCYCIILLYPVVFVDSEC